MYKLHNGTCFFKHNVYQHTKPDFSLNNLRTVHIRRPQWGGVQCGYFAGKGGGGLQRGKVRTFWRKKLWIFRNLWCVRTDKVG